MRPAPGLAIMSDFAVPLRNAALTFALSGRRSKIDGGVGALQSHGMGASCIETVFFRRSG